VVLYDDLAIVNDDTVITVFAVDYTNADPQTPDPGIGYDIYARVVTTSE
jgi:hypothetical protein